MRSSARKRARGMAYVEVLVIIGVVVTLGFGAIVLLGRADRKAAETEAGCIQTFGCSEGNPSSSPSTLAALVGNPAATPVAAPAAVAAPRAPSLREQAETASASLADAESRYDAINHEMSGIIQSSGGMMIPLSPQDSARIDELAPQLAAARDARSGARDAYNAAGQAVLDQAYGGHYGTLQHSWIDVQNTGSFLGGLAVGTWNGILDTPAAVGRLGGAAWDLVTGNSPPPNPAAERAQRVADRASVIDQELERISGPEGAARANYRDGNWDGQNVLAGVVVGEGAGLVVRGGVTAVRVARGAAATDRIVETADQIALREAAATRYAAGGVRADLEPAVQRMFNEGPNRWSRLPTSPQGEIFTRGVSGDYSVGMGGYDESLNWLRGGGTNVPRHVSTPGSEANITHFVDDVNRGYSDPLMLQGRSPALFDQNGRMASLPAGTTVDTVEQIGMFPNSQDPIAWSRNYLRMRQQLSDVGTPLATTGRGADFTHDIESVFNNTARYQQDEMGRAMVNQDEVARALQGVFDRYP